MRLELATLRQEISTIDSEILDLLSKRMLVSGKIADYKIHHGLPVYDPVREEALLRDYATRVDFDITHIYAAIMAESRRLQQMKMV